MAAERLPGMNVMPYEMKSVVCRDVQCCVSGLCMVKAVWMAPSDALWLLFCRSLATLLSTHARVRAGWFEGFAVQPCGSQWWRQLPGPKGLGRRRVVCCLHPKRGLTRPSACVLVQRRVGTAFSLWLSCWQCHASCATVRGARRRPLLPMGGGAMCRVEAERGTIMGHV